MQEQNRAQTNDDFRRRKRIRALPTIPIVLLIGVALGAYFRGPIARLIVSRQPTDTETVTPGSMPGQLWTCSMHPQVIQDKPGLCPICHMQLTPLNVADAESGRDVERKDQGASAQDSGAKKRKIKYWWDPMLSPPYISDHPGKSPMGMDLIPVYEDEVSGGTAVTIDPAVVQNMGVRLTTVTQGPLRRSIRLFGSLSEAEPRVHDVNLLVSGWIRRLHADTEGTLLRVGDPLFDLYSPELTVAVAEFITTRRAKPIRADLTGGDTRETLSRASRTKLELLGVTQEQIDAFAELDQAPETVMFTSPANGYLMEKSIVQGSAVKAGDRVLRIADHSVLWLNTQVFEQQLPFIELGQDAQATIASRPGETFAGEVIFVSPRVDPTTRTAVVRFAVPNDSLALRPGLYATVNITAELAESAVLVPREAIIDTGTKQLVFVTEKIGHFEPRKVTMGASGEDGMVQVLTGLAPGETVVTSGQFLLDTESRLREAIQKYLYEKRLRGLESMPQTRDTVSSQEPAHQQHDTKSTPPTGVDDAPSKERAGWAPQADALFGAYLDLADSLGAVQQSDAPLNVNGLVSAAHTLHGAMQGPSAKSMAEGIARAAEAVRGQSIGKQRELFKPLSEAVVKLAEASPPSDAVAPKLYVMYCSMAPGRWLQRTDRLANPFYATEMKQCGELVKTIEAVRGDGQ